MKGFRNHITILLDTDYDFPECYDNEIYYSKIDQEDNQRIEYHSNFSIKYIHHGVESYLVNGRLKKVIGGKMLVVNDQSHVINMAGVSEAFSIFIKPEIIADCLSNLTHEEHLLLNQPFDAARDFPNFYDEVTEQNIASLRLLKHKIAQCPSLVIPVDYYYELAEELLGSQITIFKALDNIAKLRYSTRKEIYRRVGLARDYLNDHLHGKFHLDDLARASLMSKYQLIRCFKQVYGLTPHRYFIIKKLMAAKTRLANSKNQSIQEVAYRYGYPNSGAFSKQFKQIFGYPPSSVIRTD